ncbi:MAG: DUF2089 domain-containing protein [Candidatus Oceanisphaera merdipullorum]|nr:DUF2089 domain-containing protein [Candidatus Oceanisphaera merdipullorum]
MAKLEKCKVCGGVVATTALTCPHCGDSLRGGLQGLDNLVKERHPIFYKFLSVGAWASLILTVASFSVAAYFIIKAYSQFKNIIGG